MREELMGFLMIGRYSLEELVLMVGESKQKITKELVQLHMVGMINAYTPDGERAEPPFDSDTVFTAS